MRGKPQGWAPLWRRTGLVLIVLVAGALRFDGMRWDDGILAHPDERFMTMVASAVHGGRLAPTDRNEPARASHLAACAARHPATGGVGGWFDTACSDFNPANVGHAGYAYGELPLAAARIAAEAVSMWSGSSAHREYGGIQVVGRALQRAAQGLGQGRTASFAGQLDDAEPRRANQDDLRGISGDGLT